MDLCRVPLIKYGRVEGYLPGDVIQPGRVLNVRSLNWDNLAKIVRNQMEICFIIKIANYSPLMNMIPLDCVQWKLCVRQ